MIEYRKRWAARAECFIVVLCVHWMSGLGWTANPQLVGTVPLTIARPLDEIMTEGLSRFCFMELNASRERRGAQVPAYASQEFVELARRRLKVLIGAIDPRVTERVTGQAEFQVIARLGRPSIVGRNERVTVYLAKWPVLDGVTAEGLLLMPENPQAGVVALPDADWTPEMFCGISHGLPDSAQFVRNLSAGGCLVVIPTLISRSDELSGNRYVAFTNQPHREFIYRQAFEVGRHIQGYEVQKVLATVDLLVQYSQRNRQYANDSPFPIGIVGVGEGGLLALHSAALDTRVRSCWVSGYFAEREDVWQEPLDRNVWGLLTEFGDAELAGLIAPRRLVIEACRAVEVFGPPAVRQGRRSSAAPGRIVTPQLASVQAEFERASAIYRQAEAEAQLALSISGRHGNGPCGSEKAFLAFASGLGLKTKFEATEPWHREAEYSDEFLDRLAAERQKRQFNELQDHVQKLLRQSHHVRDAKWLQDLSSVEDWEKRRPQLRNWVHDELIGRLPQDMKPPNARSRLLCENAEYVGYEIVLDVFEEVIASGLLLIPQDMMADEKRPLVVCQHGLEGTPLDTISHEPRPFASYKAFGEELVKRGFIVYAPQNPYRGGDRFRVLQRMLNPLKRSLFSVITAQHEQTLDWLATLPQVDSKRMAFYGLSYGGKTAMRVPPLLERYCMSICSGDFTDWPTTIASNSERFSYLFTNEYEIPEWNLAHVASYGELAMLMAPRPFMVEAGHRDAGQPTEFVASEFGRVRRHYDRLTIGDRTEIDFFDGPHTINGKNTFNFLHRHLNWPAPQ